MEALKTAAAFLRMGRRKSRASPPRLSLFPPPNWLVVHSFSTRGQPRERLVKANCKDTPSSLLGPSEPLSPI